MVFSWDVGRNCTEMVWPSNDRLSVIAIICSGKRNEDSI